MSAARKIDEPQAIDPIDRAIVRATQAGLPLVARPYHAVAAQLGIARRIAAVPNHYALGFRANGMSVWDVEDGAIDRLGPAVGALDFVSHCYRRPRRLPAWPYNLFAMAHGRTREEVTEKVERIAALLGPHCRARDVLYSTRILKKTGLRLAD